MNKIYLIMVITLMSLGLTSTLNAQSNNSDPVYIIAEVTVYDYEMYQQYQQKVAPMISKHGGRYIVRSGAEEYNISPAGNIINAEGDWQPDRIIVLKFDSLQQSVNFVTSPEYLAIKQLRTEASTTKLLLVNEYK